MTTRLMAMFVVAGCTVGLAQVPDTTKQTPMKGAVTISGCVAESTPAGQFTLNNAMTVPDTMKKEGAPGTPAMPSASDKGMSHSYKLVGGDNLKAHVGHKVEVTGTLAVAAKVDEKATPGAKGAEQELRVQSVKMVSATCP